MSLSSGLNHIAVLTVTRPGLALAARIEAALPAEVTVYVSEKYAEGAPERFVRFPDRLQPVVDEVWSRYEAIIVIGAAGIAVRLIAPHVVDKRYDPGVVVMDIAGRYAIALCSGHLGGANELCHLLAQTVGALPVVTTGTDVQGTLAPDVLAKQIGAQIENWEALKVVSGALVHGARVGVLVEPGVHTPDLGVYRDKNVVLTQDLSGFEAGVAVTSQVFHSVTPTLFIRPPNLVVGVGCNTGTTEAEIHAEVHAVLALAGLSPLSVSRIATVEKKKDEPGLLAFCQRMGLPLVWFSAEQINALDAPFEPSETVRRFVGVYGVAEPAAMLAAGARRAVVPKQKRGNLTVAVARVGDAP